MKDQIFSFMRFATLGFWALAVASYFSVFPETITQLLQLAAGIILLAHVAEMVIFRKALQAYDNPKKAVMNIMIYGVFWALPNLKPQV
jgi:uncharacterized protein YhhL (DUF1145 family)